MKRITVTKETATGRNVSFHDNYTGRNMNRVQFVREIDRIIADLISESIGTRGYGYSVHPENIISLAGDRHVIDDVLIDVEATNQVEEFVLMIWRRLDEKNKDEWGEVEYYSPVPISLEL